jgi:CubicO group peptidase (beta-lactamase class C family)
MKHSLVAALALFIFFSCRNGTQAKVHPLSALSVLSHFVTLDSTKVKQGILYHRLDSLFMRRHKLGGFNGNVLVLKGGRVLYKGCFGYCDYRSKDTLSPQTPFQIASSSKPFTATAILRLAEEGKLSLQDTLGSFFPGFPYRNITVEMLLCHRSGLPNYLYFGQNLWKNRKEYMTNDDMLQLLMTHKNIDGTTRPGTHFQYNNTNFALLACIVEKVTGKRFPAYMQETFFEPLGMHNTWVRDVRNESEQRKHARTYNSKWIEQPEDPYDGVYGDKNVFSTVEDMMIWDQAFYEEKNISQAMQSEAYKPRSFEKGGVRNYGYGWRLMKQPNNSYLVYHNGWWHGNNTVFYRYMPDTFALIILSNRYNQGVYDVQPIFNIIGATRDTTSFTEGEE